MDGASCHETLGRYVAKTLQKCRAAAQQVQMSCDLFTRRDLLPPPPSAVLSFPARSCVLAEFVCRRGGRVGGEMPGGLVDQCVMITAGQLVVFPFASLILAGEQLFYFFSKHYHHAAPLLCAQCLWAKWQWPALRCGFEVIYTVESSGTFMGCNVFDKEIGSVDLFSLSAPWH